MLITLDNYKRLIPERKWSIYLRYTQTPTYTGINGEMNYSKETEVLTPLGDLEAEALGIKWNTCPSGLYDLEF